MTWVVKFKKPLGDRFIRLFLPFWNEEKLSVFVVVGCRLDFMLLNVSFNNFVQQNLICRQGLWI